MMANAMLVRTAKTNVKTRKMEGAELRSAVNQVKKTRIVPTPVTKAVKATNQLDDDQYDR